MLFRSPGLILWAVLRLSAVKFGSAPVLRISLSAIMFPYCRAENPELPKGLSVTPGCVNVYPVPEGTVSVACKGFIAAVAVPGGINTLLVVA